MTRIFTASWGQLEKGGSNVGDEAIFASQVRDLSTLKDVEIGVMSGDPDRTRQLYNAKPFDVGGGRIRAMTRGVRWSDIVIVGGGELVQDVSSLLYTPFNLHPLRLAGRYGKKAFAWSIGIGQGDELARWTPWQLKKWLGYCSGVTVRDEPSLGTLLDLGLSPKLVKLASDSTFTLARDLSGGETGKEPVLGVALRNTSNRQRKLLPLEIRRKLGLHRERDMTPRQRKWAAVLDSHLDSRGGRVVFFPFHTGSLSNSDHFHCQAVMSMMKNSHRASMIMPRDLNEFLTAISRCRMFVTVPLHGSILSVVTGTVPLALPYASKGYRFMEQAGLSRLTVDPSLEDWDVQLANMLKLEWPKAEELLESINQTRSRLAELCAVNLHHFKGTCI